MKRRTFLAATGLATTVPLSDCLGSSLEDSDSSSNSSDGADIGGVNIEGFEEDQTESDFFRDEDELLILEAGLDTPPHEITPPGEPQMPDDWSPGDPRDEIADDWSDHYLGENIAQEPSLPFEPLSTSLGHSSLSVLDRTFSSEFAVDVVTSEREERRTLDIEETDRPPVDYSEDIVVAVHSGYGSSSKQHQFQRVEMTEDGIHLHGYYTHPLIMTFDHTARHSVHRVKRPTATEISTVTVSLTIAESNRVHFDSTADAFGFSESE